MDAAEAQNTDTPMTDENQVSLIVRGDDSGMCHSANTAVLDAFRNGILRNTSVMVPCPAFAEACEMFRGEAELCVGLHATINAEWDQVKWGPVLSMHKVPTLVGRDGMFMASPTAFQRRHVLNREILAELQAQLDLARRKGLNIRYLDEHMVFRWLPGIEEMLANLAAREGLIYEHGVIPSLPKMYGEFATPVDRLLAALKAAKPGVHLLVTHPGYDAEDMQGFGVGGQAAGEVAKQRDADRLLLVDPRVIAYCREHGVRMARFTDVVGLGR